MSAPTGNTNATRWTRETTLQLLNKIEAIALDEFSTVYTLTQALNKVRCYKQLWSYWKKKWENDEDIMDQIYFIESLFIEKLEHGALFKRLNTSTCHFILKNNYGYNTKGEEELPSYLRGEFASAETATDEKPRSGSKTKKDNGKVPYTQQELDYINDPAYKDFSDRPTDDEQMKWFRADARKHPHLYTAKVPVRGNYVKIAEDLFSPL
ncbi:MAG: hypothetical protein JST83_17400 [Bacteroidetes bacterium]|nr:hypothetical protein [Bacteroidota bacterium]